MTSGVYQILNKATGKVYIGSSADISKRWVNHRHRLAQGTHHSKKLQNSYKKHGPDAFVFSIVAECGADQLTSVEQVWLDSTNAAIVGYNILPIAGSCRGVVRSADTRAKLSAIAKARPVCQEHIAAMIASNTGIKQAPDRVAKRVATRKAALASKPPIQVSAETRAKMSDARKGRQLTEHQRQRLIEANTGKKLSQETKDKIRAARLGKKRDPSIPPRKWSDEERAHQIALRVGKTHTAEHKAKISAAGMGRVISEETKARRLATRRANAAKKAALKADVYA